MARRTPKLPKGVTIDPRNDHYRARVQAVEPGVNPPSKAGFRTITEAETWLAQQRADLSRGVYVAPNPHPIRFAEYGRQWRRLQVHHKDSTVEDVELAFKNWLDPFFGALPITKIGRAQVQAFVRSLVDAGLAPRTVRKHVAWLRGALRDATHEGLIARNPCDGVKLPRVERKPVIPPTPEQVLAIAEAIDDRYRALVLFGAWSGLRPAELRGLRACDVDFLGRRVHVQVQAQAKRGGEVDFVSLKSSGSDRVVPLDQLAVDVLAAHIATYGTGDDGLLFGDQESRPLRRQRFGEVWKRAVQRAGVTVVPSDLRDHYASLLIEKGASVEKVRARLGHASATTTLAHYVHLWPSDDTDERIVSSAYAHLLREEKAEED